MFFFAPKCALTTYRKFNVISSSVACFFFECSYYEMKLRQAKVGHGWGRKVKYFLFVSRLTYYVDAVNFNFTLQWNLITEQYYSSWARFRNQCFGKFFKSLTKHVNFFNIFTHGRMNTSSISTCIVRHSRHICCTCCEIVIHTHRGMEKKFNSEIF